MQDGPDRVVGRFRYLLVEKSAEQATQEPGELHGRTIVAGTWPGMAHDVVEWRHGVTRDAQAVLPRDLVRGLAEAEQLAEARAPVVWEELESGHFYPGPSAYGVVIEQTLS